MVLEPVCSRSSCHNVPVTAVVIPGAGVFQELLHPWSRCCNVPATAVVVQEPVCSRNSCYNVTVTAADAGAGYFAGAVDAIIQSLQLCSRSWCVSVAAVALF